MYAFIFLRIENRAVGPFDMPGNPGAQKFVNVSLKIQLGIPRPLRQLMLDISPYAKPSL